MAADDPLSALIESLVRADIGIERVSVDRDAWQSVGASALTSGPGARAVVVGSRRMKWVLIAAMTAGAVAWVLYAPVTRFFAIDACLDRGGAWNYEQERCVSEEGG